MPFSPSFLSAAATAAPCFEIEQKYRKIVDLLGAGLTPELLDQLYNALEAGPREKTVYVACPTRGHYYSIVRKRQYQAANTLKEIGQVPLLPIDLINDKDADSPERRAATLARCAIGLIGCSAIMMLDGWQESEGCRIEAEIAAVLGIRAYSEANIFTMV